ncbi:unnamed protein product [Brassicogethes aeneus]|uniref:Sulfotransferase domain-containing protein n=1 Tax=Brassicogethes aeneus TaxID=1431903 RepID=A0A9P0B417_BRAAE|nr:unnamed protein product [Brassicogethes aeneus]
MFCGVKFRKKKSADKKDKNDYLSKLLEEKYTSIFRPGYVEIDGVTLPRRYKELKNDIDDFDVFEDDIWICSFPKTGTTWTQEMIWMIVNNLDFKGGEENLGHRSPFLEVTSLFDYRKFMENNPDFKPPPFIEDSLGYIKTKKGAICLKTHLPWNLLPKQIQSGVKQPKIIYVSRNPKDTCISYYHHSKLIEGYNGNFDEFCELFLGGKLCFAPYWDHVLQFWKKRDDPNILFITYEDMKKDLPSVIKTVSAFLEKNLTEEQVHLLTAHLSFESMKNNKAVNYEMIQELNKKYNLTNGEGTFMRSGIVGDHKAHMSESMIKKFDLWTKENTKNTQLNY